MWNLREGLSLKGDPPTKENKMKQVITGNEAAALAAKLARVQVISAYPITPQTQIVEGLSEMVEKKELKAEFINVESEHSAISALVGAQAVGARTFTATSSQGLALMHEVLFFAASSRLPIVMAVVNRMVAAPLGIGCEYNDSMPQRDTGWMQFYVEDNQEVIDTILQAFKVSEHPDVFLPAMVCLDGLILSHTVNAVEIPDQQKVDSFLPPYQPTLKLDENDPYVYGAVFAPGDQANISIRHEQERAMQSAKAVINHVDHEFEQTFGRSYGGLMEKYKMEAAEFALITLGSMTSTCRAVVDELRAKGKPVGLIKIRSFRPFPIESLKEALTEVSAVGVFDRSVSFGSGGPNYLEVRSALQGTKIPIVNFIAGLGGKHILPKDIHKMFEKLEEKTTGKEEKDIFWMDLE
jgi:pyruvate/2-oxoacid:ferredoxin oxidoreductase alpha subunit